MVSGEGGGMTEASGFRIVPAFRRWAREFVIIVLGVLVALWVDGWYQRRADHERERVDLEQLLATTRENEVRVMVALRDDSSALASATRLLTLVHSSRPLPPEDTLGRLRNDAFHFSVFFPMTGTYAAIAQTGDLGLIRNDSLRAAVAAYSGVLEGTAQQIEDWTDTFHRNVEELIRTVPIGGIYGAAFGEAAGAGVWRSAALQRALLLQQIISANRVQDLRLLLEQTRSLRASLEAEQAGF